MPGMAVGACTMYKHFMGITLKGAAAGGAWPDMRLQICAGVYEDAQASAAELGRQLNRCGSADGASSLLLQGSLPWSVALHCLPSSGEHGQKWHNKWPARCSAPRCHLPFPTTVTPLEDAQSTVCIYHGLE